MPNQREGGVNKKTHTHYANEQLCVVLLRLTNSSLDFHRYRFSACTITDSVKDICTIDMLSPPHPK